MAIVPDTKDWTWTLQRACPDCGFDASEATVEVAPALLRQQASRWPKVLSRPGSRDRPDSATWSPLEYGCHVRDCCGVFGARVRSMLTEDNPTFPDWDQDAAAVAGHYADADPETVAHELTSAAERFARELEEVSGEQWERTGLRSNGSPFTVDSLVRYFLHDLVHHGWDVRID